MCVQTGVNVPPKSHICVTKASGRQVVIALSNGCALRATGDTEEQVHEARALRRALRIDAGATIGQLSDEACGRCHDLEAAKRAGVRSSKMIRAWSCVYSVRKHLRQYTDADNSAVEYAVALLARYVGALFTHPAGLLAHHDGVTSVKIYPI